MRFSTQPDRYELSKMEPASINEFLGKKFKRVEIAESKSLIEFEDFDGNLFIFTHFYECCESVEIESVDGDIDDLIDGEIIMADKATANLEATSGLDNSQTWTFYKFGTKKGYVTIRWHGESNGYYSEDVSLLKLINGEK